MLIWTGSFLLVLHFFFIVIRIQGETKNKDKLWPRHFWYRIIISVRDQDSQCTTRLLEILTGPFCDGCQTRQSSFCPFMLRRGWRENWMEATSPSELRFWLWPARSVSQERLAIGLATERHKAAGRNVWPSTSVTGCRDVMGLAVKRQIHNKWQIKTW